MFPILFGASCNYSASLVCVSGGQYTYTADTIGYLYAVDFTNDSLEIYNIADPANISLVSATALAGGSGGRNPYYKAPYLYIPYRTSKKIAIWDVSNRTSPSLASSTAVSFSPSGAALIGTTLCVSYNENFLQTKGAESWDVSNPASPSATGDSWGTSRLCNTIQASNSHFFLAGQNSSGGVAFIASLTDSLAQADVATDGGVSAGTGPEGIIDSDFLYAYTTNPGNAWITSWDISDPTNITQLDQETITGVGAGPNVIALSNPLSRLYIGRISGIGTLQIRIMDVSNPAALSNTGSISTSGEAVVDIEVLDNACSALSYAQGTGAAIHLIGEPPLS